NWLETFLRFSVFAEGVDSSIVGTTCIEHLKKDIEIIEKGPLSRELTNYIKTSFNEHWKGLT
ncbi:MAG: aldo/keto reductase, partial [Ignavibacterium album]|nr:aldo/keto reductase [Ignavibacterium album]